MIHFIDPAPGGAKKPALSQWENPDTLKHGYCACLRRKPSHDLVSSSSLENRQTAP